MASPVITQTSMLLDPSIIHVELTSRCVLKCPRCPRTELDLDYLNQEIDVDTFRRTFSRAALRHIKRFIFCGHTGDPIYAGSLLPVVRYIKSHSQCQVVIITNGSYKKPEYWQYLGSLLDHNDIVTFSVDGWDQASNNLYRINSDFDSIILGIRELRAASSCNIKWSMIYFNFNQDRVEKMRELARSLGCDRFESVRSSKFDGRYALDGKDSLKPTENFVANGSRYEEETETFRPSDRLIINLVPIDRHPWARCANHRKELFLDVRGYLMPCAWFAGGYQENTFMKQYSERLSIHNRTFLSILRDRAVWQALERTWQSDPLEICRIKCKNG